jgi:hypothetical protein
MEGKQGKPLSPLTIDRIKTLLAFTDMTIPEIAERMGCTRGCVLFINRKFQVRLYKGKRSSWVVNPAFRNKD